VKCKSARKCQRKFRRKFPRIWVPCRNSIQNLVNKVRTKCSCWALISLNFFSVNTWHWRFGFLSVNTRVVVTLNWLDSEYYFCGELKHLTSLWHFLVDLHFTYILSSLPMADYIYIRLPKPPYTRCQLFNILWNHNYWWVIQVLMHGTATYLQSPLTKYS
jgi:hypothetical protein